MWWFLLTLSEVCCRAANLEKLCHASLVLKVEALFTFPIDNAMWLTLESHDQHEPLPVKSSVLNCHGFRCLFGYFLFYKERVFLRSRLLLYCVFPPLWLLICFTCCSLAFPPLCISVCVLSQSVSVCFCAFCVKRSSSSHAFGPPICFSWTLLVLGLLDPCLLPDFFGFDLCLPHHPVSLFL